MCGEYRARGFGSQSQIDVGGGTSHGSAGTRKGGLRAAAEGPPLSPF